MVKERTASYVRVFEAIEAEEAVRRDLYSPLMQRLSTSSGSLKKLSFTVARESDAVQCVLRRGVPTPIGAASI